MTHVSHYEASGPRDVTQSPLWFSEGDINTSPVQMMWRSVQAASAGVVVLVVGYSPYWPHVGTSPHIFDSRSLVPPVERPLDGPAGFREVLSRSVADQAREILATLSLNKSQLADVLRVSRPTLYDWLDGRVPNPTNLERLTSLLRIIVMAGIGSHAPLNARFVRQALDEQGSSLVELLRADPFDEARITKALADARQLGDLAARRQASRERRLRKLGYDDPSDEQRREQLQRNIATLDWPK